jgi:hypothetical protein
MQLLRSPPHFRKIADELLRMCGLNIVADMQLQTFKIGLLHFRNLDRQHGDMAIKYGREAWTRSMGMQYRNATLTYN